MSTVIGLSFGNTTSSIAYTKEGAVEVIANPDGDRAIPSMLSYAHGDEFHGLQAKHQMIRNAVNTVGYFRDLVSTTFNDIDVSKWERLAKPVKAADGGVAYEIQGEPKHVEDILVRQFVRIHDAARDYIGRDIDGVVLALPADFDAKKRERLVELAGKAGLPVVQVIGELEAALLAHIARDNESFSADKTFVVADFGGTRSDAAVINANNGIFSVVASKSNTELGGSLLDKAVFDYLVKEFKDQHQVDPLSDGRAIAKLLLESESIRKTLSNSTTSQFGIDSVTQGFDFSGSLNRLKFELIARQAFSKFVEFITSLLKDANINPLFIDEVLLVGGVSWTPKLATSIGQIFEERTKIVAPSVDTKALSPDELIARGCAIQGSIISDLDKDQLAKVENFTEIEKLAKPIGVVVNDKVFQVLGANTVVPTKKVVSLDVPTADKVQIVELEAVVNTIVHKPEPKEAKEEAENDDDESDWGDSEDEEWEEHVLVYKPTKTLAEAELPVDKKLDVTLYLTNSKKVQVSLTSSGKTVQGNI